MFERVFENIPFEIKERLERQLEASILEGIQKVRAGGTDVLPCVIRASEIMILAGSLGRRSGKGLQVDTGAKEDQGDAS